MLDPGERCAFAAYDACASALGVLAVPALACVASTRFGSGWAWRFGQVPPDIAALRGRKPVWVHAASMGEVRAAEPLVRLLQRHESSHPLMMTTTSVPGWRLARSEIGVPAMLLPVDLPWIVGRVFDRTAPRVLIVVETELWPNLLRQAARRGVAVVLASARISPRSARRYRWVQPLVRGALRGVTAAAAQTGADAERLIALGLPRERVRVAGNLKFARVPAGGEEARIPLDLGERPLLIAASTHAGEEGVVLDACRSVWREHPAMLLLLAPRRPERFGEVGRGLEATGLRWIARSTCTGTVPPDVRVVLLDTLGELHRFLPRATMVFVGGSLVPVGGHNVLEPAAYGVPVCFGPHVDNVRAPAEALETAGAGVMVAGADELGAAWRGALGDPVRARAMGRWGREALAQRATSASSVLRLVQDCLRGET